MSQQTRPAESAEAVTPNDETTFAPTRGLYVGVSGDVVVQIGGADITFVGLVAGVIHPLSVTKVLETGTTATDIVVVR
ncbi:MAG: hypothetical protein IPL78_21320 [Chloroflexi bacterium]|nr:hypothetical protein [Chloroflexota bacterium]